MQQKALHDEASSIAGAKEELRISKLKIKS
jgi:hypothetical protein